MVALLGQLTTFGTPATAEDARVTARVNALLHAYSKKDVSAIMKMLDPHAAMYGTGTSEFYTTPNGIRGLLQADYRQWTLFSFGDPRNITAETSGNLQTVFVDTPFTMEFMSHR